MSRARDLVLDLEAITRSLSFARDLSSLGLNLCRALEPLVRFEHCILMLPDPPGGKARVIHARGLERSRWAALEAGAEQGLLGRVLNIGDTTIAPPLELDAEEMARLGAPSARSLLAQPVLVDGLVIGAVVMASSRVRAFDEFDLAVSSFVAKAVGIAWERLRREHEVQLRNSVLSTLVQVTDRLLRDDTWEGAVDEVLERLGSVTQASRAYVFENRRDRRGTLLTSQRFEWAAADTEPQLDNPDLQDFPLVIGGFDRWARLLSKGERVVGLVREFPRTEQEVLLPQGIRSILVVPIMDRDRWWGFLGVDDCARERDWTRMEIDTLQTAAHALGAAIRAARIRRRMERAQRRAMESSAKLERALEGTVGALLTIMETRDQRLANHQQRVAELALAMAQYMGLERDRQQATWLSALLHDLGKLSLPFWLVAQGEPSETTARDRFRTHVRLGQQVLSPLDLPWPVAEIVGQHHERPDGQGYPKGLQEDAIRAEALIIRVADYVETRVTRLEYGDGNSLDRVLARLEAGSGTRFGAEAVEACRALFEGNGFFFTTPSQPLADPEQLDSTSSAPPKTRLG
jgi:putative nucleotidyltransferase with HDIG domain